MQTFVYNVNEFYIKKPPQVLASDGNSIYYRGTTHID